MQVQNLLRHAMSQTISEGIVNCLIVTDSPEANIQLTRVHEHIFSRKSFIIPIFLYDWYNYSFICLYDLQETLQWLQSGVAKPSQQLSNAAQLICLNTSSRNICLLSAIFSTKLPRMIRKETRSVPSPSSNKDTSFPGCFTEHHQVRVEPWTRSTEHSYQN